MATLSLADPAAVPLRNLLMGLEVAPTRMIPLLLLLRGSLVLPAHPDRSVPR
jgi:hypothetical protein